MLVRREELFLVGDERRRRMGGEELRSRLPLPSLGATPPLVLPDAPDVFPPSLLMTSVPGVGIEVPVHTETGFTSSGGLETSAAPRPAPFAGRGRLRGRGKEGANSRIGCRQCLCPVVLFASRERGGEESLTSRVRVSLGGLPGATGATAELVLYPANHLW